MYARRVRDEWSLLVDAMRNAMELWLSPRAPAVQELARYWMDLLRRTAVEEPDLLRRYDGSRRLDPGGPSQDGVDIEMLDYLGAALWARHLTSEESSRLCTDGPRVRAWPRVLSAMREEMKRGTSVASPAVQLLFRQWEAGLDELTAGDAALKRKWMTAVRLDPTLLGIWGIDARLQHYLRRARMASNGQAA